MTRRTKRLDLAGDPDKRLRLKDGAEIALWDTGESDQEPLMFLHGFPQNRLCWEPVLRILQEQDAFESFRFIAYDLRGFGKSSKTGEGSLTQMTADHFEILDALGIHRYHLLGHDWGAAVAINASRIDPRALLSSVILNTTFWKVHFSGMWHMLFFNIPLLPELVSKMAPRAAGKFLFNFAFSNPSRLEKDREESYLKMFEDPPAFHFWINLYRGALASILQPRTPRLFKPLLKLPKARLPRRRSKTVPGPTTVLWGKEDTFCPLWVGREIEKGMRQRGGKVSFHEIADSGHFVTEERPKEIAARIHEHVASLRAK